MVGGRDLEEEIRRTFEATSKLREYNAELRNDILKQRKNFDRERKCWDREKKRLERSLKQNITETQKKHSYTLEVANEAKRLQIENSNKDISLAQCNNHLSKKNSEILSLKDKLAKLEIEKIAIKSSEVKSLQSIIKSLKDKLALAQWYRQKDISKKDSEILSLNSELSNLKIEPTVEPSDITKTPAAVRSSQKEQEKPGVSCVTTDSPCGGNTESIVGGNIKQHELVSDESKTRSSSQESASDKLDTPTIDSQNEDAPELSLRPFLIKKPSLEAKSGELEDPSALGESALRVIKSSENTQNAQASSDKSSFSLPSTTQPDNLRKISTSSTVTEKNSEKKSPIDSSAVRLQNIEETEYDSHTSIGGIEANPIASGTAASCLGLLFTFLILLLIAIILFTVLKPLWVRYRSVRLGTRENRNRITLHPPYG